jgi:hypothetical protein
MPLVAGDRSMPDSGDVVDVTRRRHGGRSSPTLWIIRWRRSAAGV